MAIFFRDGLCRGSYRKGGGREGESVARLTKEKKLRIKVHGDKNFVFLNHGNKQVRYFF